MKQLSYKWFKKFSYFESKISLTKGTKFEIIDCKSMIIMIKFQLQSNEYILYSYVHSIDNLFKINNEILIISLIENVIDMNVTVLLDLRWGWSRNENLLCFFFLIPDE